jgi:hypothetical protein
VRIRDLIHAVDPYQGLDIEQYQPDLHGWGSGHPIFASLLSELRPCRVLEVGSWKGASAIHMAGILSHLGLTDTEICCVDTWLGALEFWMDHNDTTRYKSLNLVNGFPTVYYTFLKNVAALKATQLITPFPVTSAIAARFFGIHNITFDIIYIDASHDYEDVLSDLRGYWSLVSPTGVMFGDDYHPYWAGVKRAVDEFSCERAIEAELHDDKWIFRKQSANPAVRSDRRRGVAGALLFSTDRWLKLGRLLGSRH